MSKITGAGILILESYFGKPVVTLFGNNNKSFGDLGGFKDRGETPEKTGYREGREESCNLIYIKPNDLKKYSTITQVHEYKVFILYIKNLSYQEKKLERNK